MAIALSPLAAYPASTMSTAQATVQETRINTTVRGTVLNSDGEPLPGATISVKGVPGGVATDLDGNFSIKVNGINPVLTVSYIGMNPSETVLDADNTTAPLRIVLQPNAAIIDEVVVTGYQNIKRENATGAFQQISAKDLETRSVGTLSSNLEGKIAGMVVYNNDIQIRGTGTLAASTTPLIVVDGLPIEGTLNDINPYEVEKVTVLKDAAAAAIYGARASNGVIVVTTKKGLDSKIDVEFNADFTVYDKYDYDGLNLVNAEELIYLEEQNFNWMTGESYASGYLSKQWKNRGSLWNPLNKLMMRRHLGEISDADYTSQVNQWKRNSYSGDWDDHMTRTRFEQRYNLAIRTKSQHMSNNIAINWNGDNTNQTRSYDNKLSLRYLGDLSLTSWFSATLGLQVDNVRQKGHHTGILDPSGRNSFPEYLSFRNPDGTPARHQAFVDLNEPSLSDPSLELKDESYAPVEELDRNFSLFRSTYTRGYAHLNFFPIPELKLSGMFQYEDLTSKRSNTVTGESYSARHLFNLFTEDGEHKLAEGGIYDETNITDNSYTLRFQATYDKRFLDKHEINAIAGYEFRHQKYRSGKNTLFGYNEKTLTHTTGMTNLDDLIEATTTDLGQLYSPAYVYTNEDFGNFNEIEHKYQSYYATANYTYDHRYSISGSFRIDEADLFGADKKFTRRPLWSVGAGWNAHNEEFIRDITWINLLKPRASYGVTGNINSNYSSYLTAAIYTNQVIGSKRALLQTPPNDQLRWEKTKTFDFGIDFAFLNYRINGSIDFYNKEGSDILSLVDLDPTTGWTTLNMNNACTRNRGVELQLNGDILRANNPRQVGLNVALTLAYNSNKVTRLNHKATRGIDALDPTDYKQGYPVNSLYSYMYGGVAYDEDGYQYIQWKKANGDLYDDALHTANFSTDDVIFSGGLDPKWSGSFTPTVTYRNFTLSAMAAFYLGHYFRPNYNKWTYTSEINYGSQPTREYLAFWKASDEQRQNMIGNGYIMSETSMLPDQVYYSDQHIDHADYLKLRNVVLTYSFPANICRKLGIGSMRLRAQANNVATWVRNSEGIDPERVDPITGQWNLGTPRSYTFSINVNF